MDETRALPEDVRVAELALAYADDALDDTGVAELDRALRADDRCRDVFVETLRMHVALKRATGGALEKAAARRAPPTRLRRYALAALGAAAALALVATGYLLGTSSRPAPERTAATDVPDEPVQFVVPAAPPAAATPDAAPPAEPEPDTVAIAPAAPEPATRPTDEATASTGNERNETTAPEPVAAAVAKIAPGEEPTRATAPPATAPPRAHLGYLDALEGVVEIASEGEADAWRKAAGGDPLSSGDRIRTAFSRARVVLASGTELRLNHFTTLTASKRGGPPELSMVGGEVYIATVPSDKGLMVRSSHGRAVALGTKLDVTVGRHGTVVLVTEGTVEASTDAGSVTIAPGQEALVRAVTLPPDKPRTARNVARRLAWLKTGGTRRRTTGIRARTVEDHEGPMRWELAPWGEKLDFAHWKDRQARGAALRVVFQPPAGVDEPFGQLSHAIALEPGDTAVRLRMRLGAYRGNPVWSVYLRERDNDTWLLGRGRFAELPRAWREFRFVIDADLENTHADGDGEFDASQVTKLYIDAWGDAVTFFVDDVTVLNSR